MASRALTFTSTSDPLVAKAWFAGLIEREPAMLSVIGSVADSLVTDPSRYEHPRWWAGRTGGAHGEVVAAVMHTPPHPVYVGFATADQARQLARTLASDGRETVGVGGHRDAATAFANEWVDARGGWTSTRMEFGVFDLPGEAVLPFEVAGSARLAEVADVELVNAWMRSFAAEVDPRPDNTADTPAPAVRNHEPDVGDGRVLLWENDKAPVSMAYTSAANGGVVRISGVWTPPEYRRHGYASAVVARLSQLQMTAGHRCILFTDLANPTSNAIYQAIGYRRIGDNVSIDFV